MIPYVYPTTVEDGSPVLNRLALVDIQIRDAHFLLVYEYLTDHPGHHFHLPGCKTYIYLVDSLSDGKDAFNALSETQTVPSSSASSMYLCLPE
jgi:hypothetical protein